VVGTAGPNTCASGPSGQSFEVSWKCEKAAPPEGYPTVDVTLFTLARCPDVGTGSLTYPYDNVPANTCVKVGRTILPRSYGSGRGDLKAGGSVPPGYKCQLLFYINDRCEFVASRGKPGTCASYSVNFLAVQSFK
jgi:hypothetical protein